MLVCWDELFWRYSILFSVFLSGGEVGGNRISYEK